MQDAWMARKANKIQEYADRNKWKNFFTAIKTYLFSVLKELPCSVRRCNPEALGTSQTFLNSPPPSPTLPKTDCLKGKPTPTSISYPLPKKISAPCSNSPSGNHLDQTQSLLSFTRMVASN
ncbi:unnamed protein product [Schistocephalus solidus]|uniref:Uncharacterized protein n=1 Tax=Schistocephalus solidus TaxID=70667 RepID=A0A183SJZ3_SCHSO|nr:unnamed protein product [Schistocephalus solidus]